MNKHSAQSRSYGKQALLVPGKRTAPALSREEISRCINIWASVYGLREEERITQDLSLPSRPWIGRKLKSIE